MDYLITQIDSAITILDSVQTLMDNNNIFSALDLFISFMVIVLITIGTIGYWAILKLRKIKILVFESKQLIDAILMLKNTVCTDDELRQALSKIQAESEDVVQALQAVIANDNKALNRFIKTTKIKQG